MAQHPTRVEVSETMQCASYPKALLKPRNAIEAMLITQMTGVYAAVISALFKAGVQEQPLEIAELYTNRASQRRRILNLSLVHEREVAIYYLAKSRVSRTTIRCRRPLRSAFSAALECGWSPVTLPSLPSITRREGRA